MFYLKRDLRYTPFFWNFNVKVGNLFFRLTRSSSKTSENRLLFVMKINFAGTTSPISRCRFQVVNAFTLFLGSWWDWNINLKFLLVYVQRGYLFCRDQQRIYLVLLVLQMLNINDKNQHQNPFKVLEEDMARAARTFNVIEEDEDDDIELDIL